MAQRFRDSLAAIVLAAVCGSPPWASELREELASLARQYRFSIEGLDRVGSEEAPESASVTEPVSGRLRELLKNYNHLIVSGRGPAIEKVVILGAKGAIGKSSANAPVSITRDGPHHRVEVQLTGPNGLIVPASLIIDTGASSIVLPESMIASLGYSPADLRPSLSQTASGTLPVKLATLNAVSVGGNEVTEVGVSFVEDRKLGELLLLGMSFLGRFRFTIDDERSELILLAR